MWMVYKKDKIEYAIYFATKAHKNQRRKIEDIDMIFIRENSEGEYAGSGSWLFKDKPNEVVIQDGVFSRVGCERVIRYAYELAKEFNQYYHDTPILREENQALLQYRLVLVETIARVLSKAMSILGITLPERM